VNSGGLELDTLMAKDKSEKKRKQVSDVEAEEDVEMKVSNSYVCLEG
jgi:hypothetical protein